VRALGAKDVIYLHAEFHNAFVSLLSLTLPFYKMISWIGEKLLYFYLASSSAAQLTTLFLR